MSVRWSSDSPSTCSGDMYPTVPRATPGRLAGEAVESSGSARRVRGVHLREAEVEELDAAIGGDEDVGRLDVPMADALLVGGGERARDLDAVLERLAIGDGAPVHPLPQRLAFQQLGDDVGDLALGADVEDGQDVGVVQRAGGPGFEVQAADVLGRGQGRADDLDRDVAPQARVAGAVDLAHASGAEPPHDLVRSEAIAGREGDGNLRRLSATVALESERRSRRWRGRRDRHRKPS